MPKVHLSPGESYRVSLMSYTDSSSEPHGISVELWLPNGTSAVSTVSIPTPSTSQWTMFANELQSDGTESVHRVVIRLRSAEYHGSIAALTLVRQGSMNRFDTHGERLNWRNDSTGERAWIVPYGESDGTPEADWAGLVNDQTSAVEDWSLRNRQLAIDPLQVYRLCFKARSFPPGAGSGTGLVVLGSGAASAGPGGTPTPNALYVNESFEFTDTWTTICSQSQFQTVAGDNLLRFGHKEGNPEYLVDDVQVQPL